MLLKTPGSEDDCDDTKNNCNPINENNACKNIGKVAKVCINPVVQTHI